MLLASKAQHWEKSWAKIFPFFSKWVNCGKIHHFPKKTPQCGCALTSSVQSDILVDDNAGVTPNEISQLWTENAQNDNIDAMIYNEYIPELAETIFISGY